jgi:hypothetical protein
MSSCSAYAATAVPALMSMLPGLHRLRVEEQVDHERDDIARRKVFTAPLLYPSLKRLTNSSEISLIAWLGTRSGCRPIPSHAYRIYSKIIIIFMYLHVVALL